MSYLPGRQRASGYCLLHPPHCPRAGAPRPFLAPAPLTSRPELHPTTPRTAPSHAPNSIRATSHRSWSRTLLPPFSLPPSLLPSWLSTLTTWAAKTAVQVQATLAPGPAAKSNTKKPQAQVTVFCQWTAPVVWARVALAGAEGGKGRREGRGEREGDRGLARHRAEKRFKLWGAEEPLKLWGAAGVDTQVGGFERLEKDSGLKRLEKSSGLKRLEKTS
eukprot:1377508-Rhodomonas_salina.1